MPQMIPVVKAAAALWKAAMAYKVVGIAVGTYLKVAAVAYSISASRSASRKMRRSLNSVRDQGTAVTYADPIASRRIIYGENRIGGITVFAHTTGTKNEFLHQVVALACHDLSDIGDIYYGDESLGFPWATVDATNLPDSGSRYTGKVQINKKLSGGSADSDLVTAAPTKWTTDDKLTGIASIYLRNQWDVDVFPQGASFNVSVMVRGKACYDPRSSTTVYTRNPALIERDYLVSWQGVSTSEIDDADVIAAANICDESVTIADATTQARYMFNGMLDTADPHPDNRAKIARSMAGWCAKIGGKWRMAAGAHKSSALSLTLADFRADISFQSADEVSQSANGVRAIYISPTNDWQAVDAPAVTKNVTAPNITAGARCTIVSLGTTNFTSIGASSNTVGVTFTASGAGTGTGTVDPYLGEDNGVRRWRDIELFGVTSEAQALRLMRIELEKARHDFTVIAPVNLKGYLVQAGDYVDITESRYGWTNKLFEVVRHRRIHEQDETGIRLGVDLTLREVSSAIYTRASADETTADPSPNSDKQDARDVAAPVLGTLDSDDDQLIIDTRGQIISRIKVPWTFPEPNEGTFELEYKKSADADWLPAPISPPKSSDRVAWIGPVIDGEDYDIRIRAVNGIGVHSEWDEQLAHTVIGKSEDPDPPTLFTATSQAGGVLLEWTEPVDLDISGYDIYHTTTGGAIPADPQFSVAAPAVSFVVPGLAIGAATDFWIKSRDTSGNRSTAVGPVTESSEIAKSPTLMYRGPFSASNLYYDNDDIQNLVLVSSTYYKVANRAKDGQNGTSWGTPPNANWETFTTLPKNVATGIILAEVGYFFDTVYVGDGTADKGRIMSHGVTGYGAGASGFFLGFDGVTPKLFVGNPSGDKLTWNGSALTMTGTLSVGTGDSATLINSSAISFGTRFTIVDQSGQTTLVFQKTAGQSSGNKGFHIQADASDTVLRGGDVSVGGPFSPTWSITSTTGVGMFTKIQIGADCEFTRVSANTIKTVDAFWAADTLYVGANAIAVTSATSGEMAVAGSVKASGFAVDNAGTFEFFAGAGNANVYTRGQGFEVRNSAGAAKFVVLNSNGSTTISTDLSVGAAISSASLSTSAQAVIGSYITVGSAAGAIINFHSDVNLYRGAADVLKTDDAFHALGVGAFNAITAYNGSTSDYVFLTGAAVGSTIVKGQNFRVATSASVLKFEVNNTNGDVSIAGNKVLSSRYGSTPTDEASIIACLQHHGLCP